MDRFDQHVSQLPGASKGPPPRWVAPMLATLVHEPFSRDGWIFEPKLDGERCLAFRNGANLQLFSRNAKALNGTYPELLEPLAAQRARSYIADGEVVAFRHSVTSFALLQRRMQLRNPEEARRRGVEVFYYLFDLLYPDGYDLRDVPLLHRKKMLGQALEFRDPLRFTEHRERDGYAYYTEACRQGLEGIIAKAEASRYVSARSKDWLKFKCAAEQEFVIVGYTDPTGARTGLGALLLGYYDGGRLRFAGKVGSGFDTQTLIRLRNELATIETGTCPLAEPPRVSRGVHWVRPQRVAQVAFTEWTQDGKLRHPRFLGIRKDKG